MTVMKNTEQNNKKFLIIQDTIQDEKVNQILDKILIGQKLTKSEVKFLDRFEEILKHQIKDYSHLSKNMIAEIIESLLSKEIKIICDLPDRDGKLGMRIISIENDFLNTTCQITLKDNTKVEILDNFLYNLTYSLLKHEYSLTIQDEYFEKIFKEKDEN